MTERIAIVAFGMEHCKRGVEAHASMLFDKLSLEPNLDVFRIKGSGPRHANHVKLSVLKRDSLVNRFLGKIRGYNIYWEQVFFMVRLGLHLLSKKGRYDAVYTQEYVHLVGMGKLKSWFNLKYRIVYCEGFVISRPTRLKYADSLQEINKKNYAELSEQAANQGKKMKLIPHFYERQAIELNAQEKEVLRSVEEFKADRKVLFFVGSTERPEKNFSYIWEEIKELDSSWALLICGECPAATFRKLEADFPNRVKHLYVPHYLMEEIYTRCDFFLLPALDEPFGISIIEAMYASIPLILHDTAHSRWVSNDQSQCIDMTAKGSLKKHLTHISDVPQYVLEKGKANRAYFDKSYTWEHLRTDYIDIVS